MRHKRHFHSFGRRQGPRRALIRGLVESLAEQGRIRTTLPKARELRRHIDRAVTLAKKGSLHSRRLLLSRYPRREAVDKLFSKWAVEMKERQGGYTRIIKLGPRPGDKAEMAFIEFVTFTPDLKAIKTRTGSERTEGRRIYKKNLAYRKNVRKMKEDSRRINRG